MNFQAKWREPVEDRSLGVAIGFYNALLPSLALWAILGGIFWIVYTW